MRLNYEWDWKYWTFGFDIGYQDWAHVYALTVHCGPVAVGLEYYP